MSARNWQQSIVQPPYSSDLGPSVYFLLGAIHIQDIFLGVIRTCRRALTLPGSSWNVTPLPNSIVPNRIAWVHCGGTKRSWPATRCRFFLSHRIRESLGSDCVTKFHTVFILQWGVGQLLGVQLTVRFLSGYRIRSQWLDNLDASPLVYGRFAAS